MLLVSDISGIRRTVDANTCRPLQAPEREAYRKFGYQWFGEAEVDPLDQVGLIEAGVANACRCPSCTHRTFRGPGKNH